MKFNPYSPVPLAAWWAHLFSLLALCLLCGCATMKPNIEAPTVDLTGIRLTAMELFEQRFSVKLRVQNPNALDIPISGLRYKIFLEDEAFAKGVSNKTMSIPAYSDSEFEIEIASNLLKTLGQLGPKLLAAESLNYKIQGTVHVDIPLVGKIPFEESGSIALTR